MAQRAAKLRGRPSPARCSSDDRVRLTTASDPVVAALAARLAQAGFVAAAEEAEELASCAGGDPSLLQALAGRRLSGEPLAWITGRAAFGDLTLRVDPGVYVPRWQSLELARRATALLPESGDAIDLCTGSGAIAAALQAGRPSARIVATDSDARAVACARANGIEAYRGDLFGPVPRELRSETDVVVAVVPYVPATELHLLPRDTLGFEDASHYDGGPDGTDLLRRVVHEAPRFLRPGGALLLELGGAQADALRPALLSCGYQSVRTWSDDDGDLRGLAATLGRP
jgi:release factor glutamine methyltransferase